MLNDNDKKKLRELIKEQLVRVPEGERVHIDNDILDQLLFKKITNYSGDVCKLPVWSGNFLKKIDLSEISFDDVSWSIYAPIRFSDPNYRDYNENIIRSFDVKVLDDVEFDVESGKINYSGTNAKIDFSKSYEDKKHVYSRIDNCDFSDVDLSNNDMSSCASITNSNFSNTGIKLSQDMLENGLMIINSSLRNVDLSQFEVSLKSICYIDDYDVPDYAFDTSNDLYNSGINIIVDFDYDGHYYNPDDPEDTKCFEKFLSNLTGCRINGELVKSGEELKKYFLEHQKQQIINSVLESINKQIASFGVKEQEGNTEEGRGPRLI